MLLGVTLTTAAPVLDAGIVDGVSGVAPAFAAEDTSTGMSSVSDSKLRYGAASTGDKGGLMLNLRRSRMAPSPHEYLCMHVYLH